ncbi:MAG: dienelactone hydrolase family protein [Chloroflexota bacterium]
MKWVLRIIGGLVTALIVMIIVMAGVIAWDVNMGVSASTVTNTEFTAEDGTTIQGYLAVPEGEGTFPAVLMVHEWWGINHEIIELADELASEGYVVFAPDVYRGQVASTVPGALYLRINVDMERVDNDMFAVYNFLLEQPQVADSVGVVGFCFGGDVAFNHGISNPNLDAVINLYGSTRTDGDAFGELLGDDAPPILGIFGREDQGIPVVDVEAHETALNEAGVENTITIYDDMGHAFVQPDTIQEAGAPQDAWQQILTFFDTHLNDEPSS